MLYFRIEKTDVLLKSKKQSLFDFKSIEISLKFFILLSKSSILVQSFAKKFKISDFNTKAFKIEDFKKSLQCKVKLCKVEERILNSKN